jgi:YD repeat-containing protein
MFRSAILAAILTAALAFPLPVQSEQSDAEIMGLRGSVKMVEERRAGYSEVNGGRVQENPTRTQRIEFNPAGFKVEEWFYNGYTRRNTYSYDGSGRLVAREEYSSGRLTSSWEISFDSEGSTSRQLRYDKDGSISSRVVQRFTTAGKKLSELHYDDSNVIVQRWERTQTASGERVSYSPRWGEYETTYFDEQGRITEMRSGTGNNRRRWTYSYDEAGRLGEAHYSDAQQPSAELYTFQYDSAGMLLEVSHKRDSGTPVSRRRYTYSASGATETETVRWYDQEGNLDLTWIYRYDPAGNVEDKEHVHARRPFSCRWAYSYDHGNRLVSETFYDTHDRIFSLIETTYDERGNKIAERSSGRGMAQGSRTIYEYDSAGRLLETVRYDLEGNQLSRQSSRYNERGDLLEAASYNPDGSLLTNTRYRYLYDEKGNWTQRIATATNNAKESYDVPTEILLRTIGYYP